MPRRAARRRPRRSRSAARAPSPPTRPFQHQHQQPRRRDPAPQHADGGLHPEGAVAKDPRHDVEEDQADAAAEARQEEKGALDLAAPGRRCWPGPARCRRGRTMAIASQAGSLPRAATRSPSTSMGSRRSERPTRARRPESPPPHPAAPRPRTRPAGARRGRLRAGPTRAPGPGSGAGSRSEAAGEACPCRSPPPPGFRGPGPERGAAR